MVEVVRVQLQRTQRVEEHDGAVCVSDPYYLRKREREKGLYIYINDGISLALEGGVVLVGSGFLYCNVESVKSKFQYDFN